MMSWTTYCWMLAAMNGFLNGLTLNRSSTADIGLIRKLSPALCSQLFNKECQATGRRNSAQQTKLN